MDRPRRESRQHNGITLRGLSQLTFATKSANTGHRYATILSRRYLGRLPPTTVLATHCRIHWDHAATPRAAEGAHDHGEEGRRLTPPSYLRSQSLRKLRQI